MSSIEYQETVIQPLENALVIDVCVSTSTTSSLGKKVVPALYENVVLHHKTIYRDLAISIKKLQLMRLIWSKLKVTTVYIYLEKGLFKLDTKHIEHAICKLLNTFVPDNESNNVSIIITHDPLSKSDKHVKKYIEESIHMSKKIFGARIMAMLPGNIATPDYMIDVFCKLFDKKQNVKLHRWNAKKLKKDGYNLIHSVGISSENKPGMLYVERLGKSKTECPCVAFVGKGITFDSGGLAIKPLTYMTDMKYDKIGAIYACAAMLNMLDDPTWDHVTFLGVFPFAENAISDKAFRPGDVFKSYIGKTVEIANPDAEGRLVLADAFGLLHKVKHKPSLIVDIATLTGHANSISCWHSGYYYAYPEKIKDFIETYSDNIGERMIPMPTWNDYGDILKSKVADLSNSPNDCGDAAVAAMFLREFLPKETKSWVHIDLAHETDSGIPKGNGIRTLIGVVEHYLQSEKTKK